MKNTMVIFIFAFGVIGYAATISSEHQDFAKSKRENDQLEKRIKWMCPPVGCYYVSDYHTDWNTASAFCSRKESHLAIITSADENTQVVILAEYYKINGTDGFWLDGTDVGTEGTWIWSTNEQPLTYTDFHEGEPNDFLGREDCLELYYMDNELKWNDESCTSEKRQFICEIDIN